MSDVYTVYKTTNVKNDRYYIGVHKTSDLNDEYLGSGKVLLQAIEKHGRESFHKEVLFVYDEAEKAFVKEKELLESCLSDNLCYNLKPGGHGGWDYVHANGLTNKNKTRDHYVNMSKLGTASHLKKLKSDKEYKDRWLKSVHHGQTQETKEKIRNSFLGKKRNRQWITNGITNIYHDTTTQMPDGYAPGRKTK